MPNGLAMNGHSHAQNENMNGHMNRNKRDHMIRNRTNGNQVDEELKPPSMLAANEGKMSLRKRFFSGGGPSKAEKQNTKPVLGNSEVKSLTKKEKLELFRLADGKIDLVLSLYAIQERCVPYSWIFHH